MALRNRPQAKKREQVAISRKSDWPNLQSVDLGGGNPGGGKDAKKLGGAGRGTTVEDPSALADDQTIPDAPKMIVFATIPHLQPTRISSYGETADRSERLRRYNLNDIFSTSMLLTSIRDIPLEPPPQPEYVPPWKLIRPRKPKLLPHAEPVGRNIICRTSIFELRSISISSSRSETWPLDWNRLSVYQLSQSQCSSYVRRRSDLFLISISYSTTETENRRFESIQLIVVPRRE